MTNNENAIHLIQAERDRQVNAEGWSAAHDDAYSNGELTRAGLCYLFHTSVFGRVQHNGLPVNWPWHGSWWKPKGRKADLVRAGALFLADTMRKSRAGQHPGEADDLYAITVDRLAEVLADEADTALVF